MSRSLSLLYFQLLNYIQMSVHVSCSVFLAPPVTRRMIPFDFALCYSLFFSVASCTWNTCCFLDVLFLVILFAFFVGRFFPDSHSSALVRISLRFERTEVRSLPLFLSSHSSFQLGCLHAASLQPHRASLTPLGRVRVPLVLFVLFLAHSFSPLPKFGQPFSSRAFRSSPGCTFLELAFFVEFS